jgi:hypothetical protein
VGVKTATEPFHFHTAAVLVRLTNQRARSLLELTDALRTATASLVFQHTYNALLEHHFMAGAPQNDFAYWVADTLRQRALGERLAAVDLYEATDLHALRAQFVAILDEYFREGGSDLPAPAGQEFHFLESVSVSSPTRFVAADLEGFRNALSRVAVRSIYHHFLTARLRLGHKTNDFSAWMADSLQEDDLAEEFERVDPGVSSLEDLRSRMLRLLDQRLGRRRTARRIGLGLVGSTVFLGLAERLRLAAGRRGNDERQAR